MPKRIVYRKRTARRPRRAPPTAAFRRKVLSVLKNQSEMKHAFRQFSTSLGNNINATNGAFHIEPEIPQGDKSYERTGNSIRLHKCVVTGYLHWKPNLFNSEYSASTTLLNNSHVVKLMVLKQRSSNSGYGVVNVANIFEHNNLLENSSPYSGSLLNILQDVNKDAFIQKKKISLDMKATVINNGAGSVLAMDDTAGMMRKFSYTMKFGKAGKKLDFRTSGQTQANNFPYFLTATSQNTYDGSSTVTMFCDVTTKWYYTDI